MGKKVRSARGELVDFDLLRIKEEIAAAPQSLHVRKRKDFIEQRLRRKIRSIATDIEEKKEEGKKGVVAQAMEVAPKLPDTEVKEEKEELVEVETKEEKKPETPPKTPSKQRARKKITTTEEGEKIDDAESNS